MKVRDGERERHREERDRERKNVTLTLTHDSAKSTIFRFNCMLIVIIKFAVD